VEDTLQPSTKKQKMEDADDDFVVVDKEDVKDDSAKPAPEDKPKSEL
jgi:hypothetical protein